MPAIELQRLNTEINQITSHFDQVDIFYADLVDLLEKYANWSFHPGKITYRNIQQPGYHTPPIISQKLILALKPKVKNDPVKSIELIRLLRQGKYLELHSLAIQTLALLPIDDPQGLISFISEWAENERENTLVDELFSNGCTQIRSNASQDWLMQVEKWLTDNDLQRKLTGLRAVTASVKDSQFSYLPKLYQLTTNMFMTVPQGCSSLLEELLETFIGRSPAETSFFLKQILLRNPSLGTARLVRKKLASFPPEYQSSLKLLLFTPGKQSE